MRFLQVCNGYGEDALNSQIRAPGCADLLNIDAAVQNVFQNGFQLVLGNRNDIPALVFAEERRMSRAIDLDLCADAARHRHFGQRDTQAT